MIDAIDDVPFPHCFDRLVHECLVAVLGQAHELFGSQILEVVLHFAEHKFYWICLWRVLQIVYEFEVQFAHGLLHLFGCMDREIIHEDAYFVITISIAESLKVFEESLTVNGPGKDSIVFPSLLFRNSWK